MRTKIFLMILICFLISVSLFSCTRGVAVNDNPVVYGKIGLSGYIQKGPFTQGSSVTIYELDDNFASTGISYPTETIDDFGSFETKSKIKTNFVEIHTNGFYFNEVKGELSAADITLRTLSSLKEKVNINILTTLERERLKYLQEKENKNFVSAQKQAEEEILKIFKIKSEYLPEGKISTFDSMDVSKIGDSNAVLLAISCILQGKKEVADLSVLISKIITDIKEDGAINQEKLIEELNQNAVIISGEFDENKYLGLVSIRNNIENYYKGLGLKKVIIPNFEDYIDSDNDGLINKYDVVQLFPKGNVGGNLAIGESVLTIDWSDSGIKDAKYIVELAKDKDFKNIIESGKNLTSSKYVVKAVLNENTPYFWRVAIIIDGKQQEWAGVEKFNIISNLWVELTPKIESEGFTERIGHGMVYTEKGKAIIFGGHDGKNFREDTWEYDINKNTWTKLQTKIENAKSIARSAFGMVYVGNGQIIVFGGYDGQNYLNETLKFDINTKTWTVLNPEFKPEKIRRRSIPAMTYVGNDKVILSGGAYEYWGIKDTWEYDVKKNVWTDLNPKYVGGEMDDRNDYSIVYTNNDKVIMFGGFYSGTNFDETWEYDVKKNVWTKLTTTSTGGEFKGRSGYSLVYADNGKVVMFGGYDLNTHYIQTWVYDIKNSVWTKKSKAENYPTPKVINYSRLAYFGEGKVILFGGSDGYVRYDDTWLYYVGQ